MPGFQVGRPTIGHALRPKCPAPPKGGDRASCAGQGEAEGIGQESGKAQTEKRMAESCEHGCLWIDHDVEGICTRDCGRCPDRCNGTGTA